jgi:hypothetical protein
MTLNVQSCCPYLGRRGGDDEEVKNGKIKGQYI